MTTVTAPIAVPLRYLVMFLQEEHLRRSLSSQVGRNNCETMEPPIHYAEKCENRLRSDHRPQEDAEVGFLENGKKWSSRSRTACCRVFESCTIASSSAWKRLLYVQQRPCG